MAASAVVNKRSIASTIARTRSEQQLLTDMGHLEDQYEAVRNSAEKLQEGLRVTSAELQAAQRDEAAAKESAKTSEHRARLIVEGAAIFVGLIVCLGISGWSYPFGRKTGDEKGAGKDVEWAEPAGLPKQAAYQFRLAWKLSDLRTHEFHGKAAHKSPSPAKLDGYSSDSIATNQEASQVTGDQIQAIRLTDPDESCVGTAADVKPATQVATGPATLATPRGPATPSARMPCLQTPATPTPVSPPPASPKSPLSMAQTAGASPVRCQYFHMDVDVGTHKASPPDQRCIDAASSGSKAGGGPCAGSGASSRGNSLSREDEDAWWGRP